MKQLKVASSVAAQACFLTSRQVVGFDQTDLTDIAAAVLTTEDVRNGMIEVISNSGFDIPVFFAVTAQDKFSRNTLPGIEDVLLQISGVFDLGSDKAEFYGDKLETAARRYEDNLLPPFFGALKRYEERGNSTFACPGHQGGQFFRKHPAGRQFFEFFGETLFRSDRCNADVEMGDLLIHEGVALAAQQRAAQIYNADKTYFVLNGTSASNKVVTNALLTPGDVVLFDRNNHKSVHQGALFQAGATPLYLETARNPYGFIGGIDAHCFDETYLRERLQEIMPEKAAAPRPFRLAVIQLGTYDGTIYNARQVVDKIGHLCDYILFDSAWVGYEQFIPMMRDCSPMLLELGPDDPGIFVTQSIHKQQAGFSQASQIHKKDRHIKGQDRYCNHHRLNNSFMAQASTSPFYPLFASLDVNARMHSGRSGLRLWSECVRAGIEARKMVMDNCTLIRPFVPPTIDGKYWQDYSTDEIASNLKFFMFHPDERWHAFEGYNEQQYFIDPCKLLFTTPGIDAVTGQYTSFGIHAGILATFLRQNGIVPEKSDLNSILFLLTPAEDKAKMHHLVAQIARFERFIKDDAPLSSVLPGIYAAHEARYKDYTIVQLCQEMHNLYAQHDVKQLQKEMFRQSHMPAIAMGPRDANLEFIRGNVELIPLESAQGRIATEGALPYPPGVLCVVPGEVWDGAALKYFLALQDAINQFPGFTPELQGVYLKQEDDGRLRAYGYVLKQ
ncbi:ornithine decarboxylase [Pseudomonas sp. RTC3]|uniref:ornithine decarboxylase n=1 Tax=unclassified Pseudomonas TaxID=196821 RepID=UPI002AB4C1D0|nr:MULTISPECIES: ornithine decarboxylase [unclassified Pseudomonas]MEB0063531.1 ornithine decarboxylase [Pseudomonas sp. RTC3]MDY7565105.1 ornithine decarboxylase [Pseudomonas sp. 5C2]MEB0006100.1 ornithine decarboxylase [Pseudomonas sp. RTB2]MEB0018363.1 ornithine decarboxylase [Pseudomonas sp. RTB3]MEB0025173.1 ornithine decarboxylase [Pseudomonas sp. MH9.2]